MTCNTNAQNKAAELFHSKDKRALHQYLERWRNHKEDVPVDYILFVVSYYNMMSDNSVRPDFVLGALQLKFDVQRALWRGMDADLTCTEFRVVKALTEQMHSFLTYRALYDVVHYVGFAAGSGIDGYKVNVRSVIKRIRKKFEKLEPQWDHIENYAGFGYRWLKPEIELVTLPVAAE